MFVELCLKQGLPQLVARKLAVHIGQPGELDESKEDFGSYMEQQWPELKGIGTDGKCPISLTGFH